jgi:hypothetical protein
MLRGALESFDRRARLHPYRVFFSMPASIFVFYLVFDLVEEFLPFSVSPTLLMSLLAPVNILFLFLGWRILSLSQKKPLNEDSIEVGSENLKDSE